MDPGSKTASSTTETYIMGANSSTQSPAPNASSNNSTPHESATMPAVDDDSSDSDVSMSAETDDEEENISTPIIQMHHELPPKEKHPLASSNPEPEVSKKRKLSDSIECMSDGHGENGISREITKRLKPDDAYQQFRAPNGHLCQDRSLLPAEIWQHIFTFTPPRVLGQLLQVNKKFHAYLDSSLSANHVIPLPRSCIQLLKPDAIWQSSRRLFRPNQPVPLNGMSELEMWRLACCVSCQFCSKKRQPSHMPQMDQWHPGPGQTGVIPIWSFAIRTCGPCLEQRTIKHIDLLTSPTFEEKLMGALPFVFLTNELHIIPPTTLQKAGSPPSTIQINKQFLRTMTEAINQEYIDVSAKMGAATAQEWLKGLDEKGGEQRNDATRWERWEASGGVSRMRRNEPHEAQKFKLESAIPPLASIPSLPAAPPSAKSNMPNLSHASQYYQLPQPIHTAFPNPPARYDSPSQNGFSPHPSRSQPQTRHERTKEEVAEMKAARRTEIERRCMLLDPPLTPGVLAHMSSYQAAIQIIQPLTDQAWEVLKPRLLSQRGEAEQREKDRIAQTRVVQERFDASRWQGAKIEDSKEVIEREWEDVQAPLRTRIGGYADEIIRDGWNGGAKVTRENCTSFAAEVLVYVRKRFYAEIAKDEAASRAAGQTPAVDPPNGPYTRKLILENMKWVFDTKIKPITEQYRKELFLCNDCDGNFKYYGFEGVIQHFAAKHTTALSLGSVVVHWKSEWPEYPPFKPDPNAASHSYYNAAPSASDPYGQTMQQTYGYNGYHQQGPASAPMQPQNPHAYQESPAPYYGHPQYGDQYTGHQNGPFAPPPPQQSYIDPSQGYPEMQYSAPPPHSNVHGYSQGPQDYSQQAYAGHYPVPPQGNYESPHPGQAYPASVPDTVGQQPAYYPQGNGYGPGYHQPPVFQNAKPQQASNSTRPPQTAEYKSQLLEVAAAARDVWKALNGVKEVPGSVKVYTIIYHILKKSRAKYQNDPPLSMISDGLNNNKDMRQVRNVNGLLCRACVLGMAGSAGQQKKHFSLPQLVNHFHSVHEVAVAENGLGHIPDWTQDMVELPDTAKLSAVARAPGMDDSKLSLFAEALPQIVAKPEPNVNEEEYLEPVSAYEPNTMRSTYDPPPSQDNHDKYYKSTSNTRPSDIESNNYQNSPDKHGYHEERSVRGTVARRSLENRQPIYEDPLSRHYVEQGAVPVQVRTVDDRERYVVREEAPLYTDRAARYRAVDPVEHRGRTSYDPAEPALSNVDYRQTNTQPYRPNAEDLPTAMARIAEQQKLSFASRDVQLQNVEPSAPRHKPITEVITELARATKIKKEPLDAGSEDGELPAEPGSRPAADDVQLGDEADRAAERFLNDFLPNNPEDDQKRPQEIDRRREDERRSQWEAEHGVRRVYQQTPDPQRRMREGYEDDGRIMAGRPVSQVNDGYVLHERPAPPQARHLRSYEDPYGETLPAQALPRERSPELVDRRFKLNNVVYREDRQTSQGMHRTPSRYARYESVRLENDRARSRSPVYVKMGAPPGQYRDRSPVPHSLQQEPVYRRSPPGPPEEIAYERAPRQEYYRVYADEPRQRQPAPQYAEAFEYVQVSDPDGDYMIRRPVRREHEPIYIDRAMYEDEVYGRQPVYESRRAAPMSRSDPAYYEEYDPRHPAPPPPTRQVRYE